MVGWICSYLTDGELAFVEISKRKKKRIQRVLSAGVVFALAVTTLAFWQKGALVDYTDIEPALLKDPVQGNTTREDFTFGYREDTYTVHPVAEYELWGLVVSHNDTTGFGDIYHDSDSVDTKDLSVIWGKNLRNNDFHKVEFWSGSFTCYWKYPGGVTLHPDSISNNHLVTSKPELRDTIEQVRVGDQVHIKGMLVNYQTPKHPDFWRKSSTSRTDSGNYACEVVFAEEVEILRRGTPFWYAIYPVGWLLLGLALLAKIALFLVPGKIDVDPPDAPADSYARV